MARVALGPNRSGPRVALDDTTTRCAPCAQLAAGDVTEPVLVPARVIVRHRTKTGTDDDGVAEYGWDTVYDGPGIWTDLVEMEDDDATGATTQVAGVTIGPLEVKLETTASVWDEDRRRWDVTAAVTKAEGGVSIDVSRRIDNDA